MAKNGILQGDNVIFNLSSIFLNKIIIYSVLGLIVLIAVIVTLIIFRRKKKQDTYRLSPLNMTIENLLVDWLKQIGLLGKVEIMWLRRQETIKLFADNPGWLIGKHGCNIEQLKLVFSDPKNSAMIQNIQNVEIHEVCRLLPHGKWTQKEIDKSDRRMMEAWKTEEKICDDFD